jgi:hypothetical protein
MMEVAALDKADALSNPRIKVAIIADTPKVLELVNSYVTSGFSHYPLRIFNDISYAWQWLGISVNTQS